MVCRCYCTLHIVNCVILGKWNVRSRLCHMPSRQRFICNFGWNCSMSWPLSHVLFPSAWEDSCWTQTMTFIWPSWVRSDDVRRAIPEILQDSCCFFLLCHDPPPTPGQRVVFACRFPLVEVDSLPSRWENQWYPHGLTWRWRSLFWAFKHWGGTKRCELTATEIKLPHQKTDIENGSQLKMSHVKRKKKTPGFLPKNTIPITSFIGT